MCIQSYYNYSQDKTELELDLLSEIKKFGIREWKKMVEKEMEKIKTEIYVQKSIPDRPLMGA